MMLATHHSHLDASNDPKTETTTKKATRVGRWGQGLKMQMCLEPQISFFYYFIHFLNYTNVLQVPRWRTATMMLTTHHSHLDASNDPKTETTTKKVMRVGRWGQGLKMQTCLNPQVSFFTILYIFKNYTNVLQVPRQQRTTTTTTMMLAMPNEGTNGNWGDEGRGSVYLLVHRFTL